MKVIRSKIILIIGTLITLALSILPTPAAALNDNCPIGLTVRASQTTITDISQPITFTVDAMRTPPAGDRCTSEDTITAYVVFKDIDKKYGPIKLNIPVEGGSSSRTGSVPITIAGSGATVKTSYQFYAAGEVARKAGEKPIVTTQLNPSNTVTVQYIAPGTKDTNQIFFTDDKGQDFGNGKTVQKNTSGYKIVAKVAQQSSPKNYSIRVTRLIDGKKDGDNYALVIPETSPPGNSDGSKEQQFTKGITFPKPGNYTFYLDYKDSNNPDFSQINSVNITVADSGGNTNTNSNGNGNSNSSANLNANGMVGNDNRSGIGEVPNYDNSIGEFQNLLKTGTVPELVARAVRILLALAGMVSVVVIILAGFRMVSQGDNPSEVKKARNAIQWAIIGLITSLLSFSIVAIIQRIIQR